MSSPAAGLRQRPVATRLAVPALGTTDFVLAAGLAVALAAIAFGAQGGSALGRTTYTEIGVTLGGGALAAAALVVARPAERVWGGVTLALFAALAALTTLSIIWSVEPSDSWLEANRTLSYVAAFAGGIALARLFPRRAGAVVAAVGLACVAVCGWALLTKVFPGALNPDELHARLRAPFGYWNATGLMAALGVPALLWLGTRREGPDWLRALAYPALGLLMVTVLLSYSRGSLVAIALGGLVWFAFVPLRLRGLALLLTAAAGTALLVAWSFSRHALSHERVPLAQRAHDGHLLGLLLIGLVALLLAAGLVAQRLAARPLDERLRRRIGTAAIAAAVIAPLAALAVLASTGGGLSGRWHNLTDPNVAAPRDDDPGRLTAASSVRARYWSEAGKVWRAHRWIGAGAGGYGTARKRYRRDQLEVQHAHGYVVQTLADMGWAGLGLSVAALVAALLAMARATGLRRRDRGRPFDAERIALVTLAATAVTFGVHSTIDWTWFVPGTAVLGLLCAAYLAGRGPLDGGEAGRRPAPITRLVPARPGWRGPAPARLLGALAVALVALASAWAIWQPQRSDLSAGDALAQASTGRLAAARSSALRAHDRNPLAAEPLFDLALVQDSQGQPRAAERTFERAVRLQPANPDTWRQLAAYQLDTLDRPARALTTLRAALYLDPRSAATQAEFLRAYRAAAAGRNQRPSGGL